MLTMDPSQCYAAMVSRDRRFDGRFFVGVRSTGIYCRPVCPARTPLAANVEFYATAAGAAARGYRACLRCRPETAPGCAAWTGTAATVTRALRLIEAGSLDGPGRVPDLAARLGVSERHLRSLFSQHLGASPVAVAQNRRLRRARVLLLQTALPMDQVARSSGFSSVRRFNAAMQRGFGRSPSQLRGGAKAAGEPLQVQLEVREPFSWEQVLRFLARRALPGAEAVVGDRWRHALAEGPDSGVVEVGPGRHGRGLLVRAPTWAGRTLPELLMRLRLAFDLDAPPERLAALAREPELRSGLERWPDVRLVGGFDPFAVCVRVILGQQVSVAGATTLAGRVVARWGQPVAEGDEHIGHTFPVPSTLADAPLEEVGLTGARSGAVRELAAAVRDGSLTLMPASGLQPVLTRLLAQRGVGPWTAHVLAMRVFGEPDAWPAGDLGLRKRLGGSEPVAPGQVERWGERVRPWRSYAAMALWA